MKKFVLLVITTVSFISFLKAQEIVKRFIRADMQSITRNKSLVFNECVGAGRANEGLRADWQQQLAQVKNDMDFKYIRFHGLLHDDMRVYAEDKEGKPVYNWQYVDKLFDYLLSIKVRPFVEFSFMPADLASGTKTIFWWKGNVTKPKSYGKWDSLITNLVTHWKERYGQEEVVKWYFEVWNEPDLQGFFNGTQADYFELYDHTSKAIKAVSNAYRVGGPATSATKWISEFLSFCNEHKLPVDFVSTHDYGTTTVLDEFGTKRKVLKSDADSIAKNVNRVRKLIDASPYKNAELHFTEWNSSSSSRDPIHDTYENATYILNTLKKATAYCNSMSYWTFTDIFEEAGPGQTPFHGGFGLFNLEGIRKPTYYAYQFMHQLGEKELKNADNNSYVCRSANGKEIQALIWDYSYPKKDYTANTEYFTKIHSSAPVSTTTLSLTGLANGKYKIEVYRVGYLQNDAYSVYLNMGRPSQLTLQQEKELKKQSSGLPVSIATVSINDGKFNQVFPLKENDIVFVKLVKQ